MVNMNDDIKKVDDNLRSSVISMLAGNRQSTVSSSSSEKDVKESADNHAGSENNTIESMLAKVIESKNQRDTVDSDTRKKVLEKVFRKDILQTMFEL